ncbi:MAG: hypothetical protein D6712_03175 [Chloroflexi bacterium]|nr:MAG: hypothetical protein D6712_03175 [Chloroflexota bacterium]
MLTYATVDDFIKMRELDKVGLTVGVMDKERDNIRAYLMRATSFAQRYTRRDFFPARQVRKFPIPHTFFDLSIRRLPYANLYVDQDLLEVYSIDNNGQILNSTDFYLIDNNVMPYYGIALSATAQSGWRVYGFARHEEPIISVDALWGFATNSSGKRYPDDYWINTTVSLSADIDDTTTTISIPTPSTVRDNLWQYAFTEGRLLKIEDEFMVVMSVDDSANAITVQRGARGSTAASHLSGNVIYRWNVPEDIVEAVLQIAKTMREADVSIGGRIGVSDVSPGVELSMPADALRILTSYQRSMVLE